MGNQRAVLCDFGISRLMTDLHQHRGLTTDHPNQEMTAYLARELITDESSWPTTSSDVYAFGAVILEVSLPLLILLLRPAQLYRSTDYEREGPISSIDFAVEDSNHSGSRRWSDSESR